eukprot:CAMPEP_0119012880 /NCGR_PEP_ID=MMETSP1176-20130426/7675_1 /TAXON_ID=265551 /ORGANISM="Synedropsis recta cf, Strain CCMP1620" /LENGTH=484 /DNA_ID=CAMNT_0006965917 /DNA_START=28 /DNA_END=1482 /DNA_ORIENTATION=+
MMRSLLLVFLPLLLLLLLSGTTVVEGVGSKQKADRSIVIYNFSNSRVEVSWVNPDNGNRALMSEPNVLHGASFNLNSYVNHNFEVKELPHSKTGECRQASECRSAIFTVNDNENQHMEVNADFEIVHKDHKTQAQADAVKMLDACKIKAVDELDDTSTTTTTTTAEQALQNMAECMQAEVLKQLKDIANEVSFEEQTRKKMGGSYENYTCMDFDLDSTEPIERGFWLDPVSQRNQKVGILHDRPASKIHVIDDFITVEECQAMEDAARPTLRKAVVADGAGGHSVSENRKAMQAGIVVPWDKEDEKHPIATISRRVYDYANDVLGLGIEEHGQENLMSIQYFTGNQTAAGGKYEEFDQYLPHCDGDCTGDPHKYAGRVATMVMYCTVPTKGGATNFRNSGLHVQAKKGSAVFFSYFDNETGVMDSGFTEHSGCPVVEGEKKIVTQWIRYGVTKEVPWTAYNSLGILYSEANEQDYGITPDGSQA